MLKNPIIPGFNPDPCIVRVGDDYYIVTSTFEWFPGVPLYHSRDLKNWRLVRNLLDTKEYLDVRGVAPSEGVWAPGLSYSTVEKRFYLAYSIVHCRNKYLMDVDNYIIWAEDPAGEWSKPLYVNSSGFDPYLFCDDDGRKWLVNKDRDFRPANIEVRPIIIQEFDEKKGGLVGEPISLINGFTRRKFGEAPFIYKRNNWYYLVLAEGGTGYAHCASMGRSRSVTGPYEPSPYNPIVTCAPGDFEQSEGNPGVMPERYNPDLIIQKAGHGTIVETQNGECYLSHLCGRPILPQLRCILGRETAIQRMEWTDDNWLTIVGGGNLAKDEVLQPNLAEHPFPKEPERCVFDGGVLNPKFITAHGDIQPDWLKLPEEGGLHLRGRETLSSNFDTSLIAQRLTAFRAQATTKLNFEPTDYHHLAGITCIYSSSKHYCAYKTFDDKKGVAVLSVYGFEYGEMTDYGVSIVVPAEAPVYLRAEIDSADLRFSYSLDDKTYEPLGGVLDMTILSDEVGGRSFTGSMVGMFVQDIHTKSKWARFDYFELTEV